MNDQNCIICFEDIDSSDMIRKWDCCHTFHKSCIHNWDNKCPMCRNENLIIPEITFQITRNPTCPLWLQCMSNYTPILEGIEVENIKTTWKDEDCIEADANAPLANKELEATALVANKEPDSTAFNE